MTRVDIKPQSYHLRSDTWELVRASDGSLLLLVYCTQSAAGFCVLLKLNEEELREFHGLGWLMLQHLAHRVAYFTDEYWPRAIKGKLLDEVIALVGFRAL